MEKGQENQLPPEIIMQMQFTKIGQLVLQLDMMHEHLVAMEAENKELKAKLTKGPVKGKKK